MSESLDVDAEGKEMDRIEEGGGEEVQKGEPSLSAHGIGMDVWMCQRDRQTVSATTHYWQPTL